MNALQGYLEKFGGNFLVASFIPSIAFVIVSILTLGPIIPDRVLGPIQHSLNPLGDFGIIIIFVAVIIGFTLTSLNTQVYKFFEGYVFFKQLSFLRSSKIKQARELRSEQTKLARRLERLRNQCERWEAIYLPEGVDIEDIPQNLQRKKERLDKQIKELEAELTGKRTSYDLIFPPQDDLVLPTKLGNILRAAEVYPLTRYNMDSVVMWPRMVHAASTANQGDNFMAKVDFSNDQCSFLLNVSLLSGIYAGLSIMASLYQGFILFLYQRFHATQFLYFIPIDKIPDIYTQRIVIYLVLGVLGLWSMWFFYHASLWNVSAYGSMIRSTYDLFRFELFTALHLSHPKNNKDDDPDGERFMWQRVSALFKVGYSDGPIVFDYDTPEKSIEN